MEGGWQEEVGCVFVVWNFEFADIHRVCMNEVYKRMLAPM